MKKILCSLILFLFATVCWSQSFDFKYEIADVRTKVVVSPTDAKFTIANNKVLFVVNSVTIEDEALKSIKTVGRVTFIETVSGNKYSLLYSGSEYGVVEKLTMMFDTHKTVYSNKPNESALTSN